MIVTSVLNNLSSLAGLKPAASGGYTSTTYCQRRRSVSDPQYDLQVKVLLTLQSNWPNLNEGTKSCGRLNSPRIRQLYKPSTSLTSTGCQFAFVNGKRSKSSGWIRMDAPVIDSPTSVFNLRRICTLRASGHARRSIACLLLDFRVNAQGNDVPLV